jgi:hypothetical protein
MKPHFILYLLLLAWLAGACQSSAPTCPSGSLTYLPDAASFQAHPLDSATSGSTLQEIGGKMLVVDRVIHGPLCNDTLSGTVYVACDLQIVAWADKDSPTFLKDCEFHVQPGSVIYVAAHNDAAYYQGCSCHTGEAPGD